eukprot:8477075-Pyramimonas_sp.AAC.1
MIPMDGSEEDVHPPSDESSLLLEAVQEDGVYDEEEDDADVEGAAGLRLGLAGWGHRHGSCSVLRAPSDTVRIAAKTCEQANAEGQ